MTNLVAIVTAYCHCAACCGVAGGPTASGRMPEVGITVAAPRNIPFGTWIEIPGVGLRRVDDRVAKKFEGRFDVFMRRHVDAKKFGARTESIRVGK